MIQSRYMPPKLHCIQLGECNEGSLLRSKKDSTGILQDLNQRLDWEKGVVSCFNEADIVKELSSRHLFHFITRLTKDQELSSRRLDSFF